VVENAVGTYEVANLFCVGTLPSVLFSALGFVCATPMQGKVEKSQHDAIANYTLLLVVTPH